MLELREVSRRWKGFSLSDVSLRVDRAEYFVLLGPSGAGKSLMLELIAGFHTPDRGRILLDGRDVTRLPPERREVGFVYQDSMLFPHRSARENIAYGLRLRGHEPREVTREVKRLARMLRIQGLLERMPATLSGGESQRVSIARALAVRPRVLLLDEPLGALDPPTQEALRGELSRVHRETGVTVLHVTHDQAEARELGQRVGILRRGRLVQVGPPQAVFERPDNHFVAEFTGCANIFRGRAAKGEGATLFRTGEVELVSTTPIDGPARAAIRPENILISREPVRTSARNQLAGKITSVRQQGRTFAVTGLFDGLEMTSVITAQSLEELDIRPGAEVFFSFKAGSLHLMEDAEGTP
ncbi:MAG: ATP-binding cassette domain-containing protein [Candidatus Brocadiaceae bacterium]|jgi:molybdate/tungstate transport system ATP-binding protein